MPATFRPISSTANSTAITPCSSTLKHGTTCSTPRTSTRWLHSTKAAATITFKKNYRGSSNGLKSQRDVGISTWKNLRSSPAAREIDTSGGLKPQTCSRKNSFTPCFLPKNGMSTKSKAPSIGKPMPFACPKSLRKSIPFGCHPISSISPARFPSKPKGPPNELMLRGARA